MYSDAQQPHIAIIGGGIAGLALGIGLSRRNVHFTIYEAAPGLNAIGAGIALGPNTTRAMALIDPALRQGYDKISMRNQSLQKIHTFADFLLAEPGFGTRQGFHGAAIESTDFVRSGAHRKDLLQMMKDLLPRKDCIRFGMRANEVCQIGNIVKIKFEGGQVVEADAVVGCDGGKGITRKAVLADRFPDQVNLTYSGRYVYRGLIPPGKAQETLGELANDSKIFIGKNHYFAAYPLAGGAFNFLGGIQDDQPWIPARSTQQVLKDDMLADFEGCDPRLLHLLSWAEPMRWGLFHHLSTPTYVKGRIVLLGDVAHASTPHQGAGAGQCFEDALILAHVLGRVDNLEYLEVAFQVYDSICRPRGQEIVRTSDEAGHLYAMTHSECGDDIAKIVANANGRFQWIWSHDLQFDLTRAEKCLAELCAVGKRSCVDSLSN